MFEKPTDQLAGLKVEILDKTAYCLKRRTILLTTTADELKSGMRLTSLIITISSLLTGEAAGWTFNVELTK